MSAIWTIFRRELGAYFGSAIAAIFLIVFTLFTNGLFMLQFFQGGRADMRGLFATLPFTLIMFIPAVSMRLWAEEKRGNTFELLLTFPMKPHELVAGKFLASFFFYLTALATTLTVPLMLMSLGGVDRGMFLGGYLGAALMGALFLSVGIFISGLCKDQIVAFVLTVVTSFVGFFLGTDLFAVVIDGWMGGVGTFLKNYVGVASHLDGFNKGVADVRDALYFIVMIVVFLFLNGLSLEGRYRPKAKLIFSAAVAVCAVSVILVHWLVQDMPLGRHDLTEGRVYTVSDASRKILTGLKVPVQAKLYITPPESMPTVLKTMETDLADKLEELRVVSEGKFQYRVIHLTSDQQDDTLKQKLRNEGVMPFQVESVQQDELGVKLVYATLVLEYKEKPQEILPRLIPQSLGDLEYQILSRVYKMSLEDKPKVAVYAPLEGRERSEEMSKALGESGERSGKEYEDTYKTAVTLIRNNGYDVQRIALTKDDPIPDKTQLLLVMAPGEMGERQRYEINRYLHGGGTVVVAAQGYQYTFSRQDLRLEAVPERLRLDINPLLEKWGVRISEDILMDESSQVIQLNSGERIGPFALQMPIKFPNQIVVQESQVNRESAIMRRVGSIGYLWGSALALTEETMKTQGLRGTTLFSSSSKSWTLPSPGSLNETNIQPPAGGPKGPYPLGVLIEGKFKDVFGTRPGWTPEETAEPQDLGEPKEGRLLVIGCSKAFTEDLIQNPGNLGLFANIVDGLVLGEGLVDIRSKATVIRDLKPLSSGQKAWYRFWVVALVPILIFILSLVRIFIRQKEKEFYLAATSWD